MASDRRGAWQGRAALLISCGMLCVSDASKSPSRMDSVPATMRAVQAAAPGCVAPDFSCVGVVTVPTPKAKVGEVLIRANGSSCGVTDVVEAGLHPWFPLGPQRLLGYAVAGTVAATGPGVARLKVGDAVYTMLGDVRMGPIPWITGASVDHRCKPPSVGGRCVRRVRHRRCRGRGDVPKR